MKELSRLEIATCKRTAASVKIWRTQLAKKKAKRDELNVEIESLEATIAKFEAPIVELTGGFTSEEVLNGTMEATMNSIQPSAVEEEKEEKKESVADMIDNGEYAETVLPYLAKEEQVEVKPDGINLFGNPTDNTDPLPFE